MTRIIRVHVFHIALWAIGLMILGRAGAYYNPPGVLGFISAFIYSYITHYLFPWISVRYETHK